MSGAAVRVARRRAHEAFDRLWESAPLLYGYASWESAPPHLRRLVRDRAYAWLAEQLGVTSDACHIALFDECGCAAVVQACEGKTPADVRAWAEDRKAARAAGGKA